MLAICMTLLITVTYSSYGQEIPVNCYKMQRDECSGHGIPREIPDTVTKLQEACSGITESLACILKVREDCDPNGEMTTRIRRVSEYIQSICDEDSSTYRVLANNIHCLASSVEQVQDACRGNPVEGPGSIQHFRENIESHLGEMSPLSSTDMDCVDTLLASTCGSVVPGILCGDEVEDVIFDITEHIHGQNGDCSPELSALKASLRTAFRDAIKAEERFMNNTVQDSGIADRQNPVEE